MVRSDGDEEAELSRSLVALRKAAGLRQVDVVTRTTLSQAQLSRIERGKSLPTEAETRALADLYGAEPAHRDELEVLARDARAGIRDTRLVVQRGRTLAMQQRWRRIESDAHVIRSYHSALVLGVLQVPAYAAVVLEQPVDAGVVRDRELRRQALLTQPQPEYVLVQTEGALRLCVATAAVMAEQVDGMVAASLRPNVRLGIIPGWRAVDVVAGANFHIYDDSAVVVGLEVAAATLTDVADVRHFRRLFERLSAAAVWGDESRAELRRIAEDYRGLKSRPTHR